MAPTWAVDHVSLDTVNGIPPVGDDDSGILMTAFMTAEWGLPDGLVLLAGDGHWWIALDDRASGPAGPPAVLRD